MATRQTRLAFQRATARGSAALPSLSRGRAAPRARSEPKRAPRRWGLRLVVLLVVLLTPVALAVWLTMPDVARLARENPPTTAFIELRRAEAAERGRRFDLRWIPVPRQRISRYVEFAVVAAEDARFFSHGGIDWDALHGAVRHDLAARRIALGGSTLTQQLAKNLYLSPSKNPIRKLRELVIARALERELDKRRILELYLNVVEWGDGVFGIEAAARHYYKKSAAALTPAEAARLAVALPAPRHRSPRTRSPALDEKAGRLIDAMRWRGVIDAASHATARASLGLR